MEWTHPIALTGVGVALGAVLMLGISAWRKAQLRRRIRRREQVRALGRRYELDLLGDHLPSDLVEQASRFRGRNRGVDLDDVLIGNDREGRYWLARRAVAGSIHHVLGFEIRGSLNVRGLHVEPRPSREAPLGWQEKLTRGLRGRLSPGRRDSPMSASEHLRVRVTWDCPAHQMADEAARRSVDRWIAELTEACSPGGKTPVGLEVHGDRAWVHSLVPLEGVALTEFLRRGLEMRRQVLDEVRRRPATLSAPVRTVTAEDQESEQRAREETQPLFAVPSAEGVEDPSDEDKTVLLSAADLLREVPDPRVSQRRRRRGRVEFEIPEPEEEVILIRTR